MRWSFFSRNLKVDSSDRLLASKKHKSYMLHHDPRRVFRKRILLTLTKSNSWNFTKTFMLEKTSNSFLAQ